MDKKPKKQKRSTRSKADEVSTVINSVVGLLPGILGIIQLFRTPELVQRSNPSPLPEREYIRDAEGNLIIKKYSNDKSSK